MTNKCQGTRPVIPPTLIHFNHIRETANPTSVYTNQLHDRKLKFPTSASEGDLLQFPGWLLMSDVKTPERVEKALTRAKGFLHSRRDESCLIKSATFGRALIFWCFSLSKCRWFLSNIPDVSQMHTTDWIPKSAAWECNLTVWSTTWMDWPSNLYRDLWSPEDESRWTWWSNDFCSSASMRLMLGVWNEMSHRLSDGLP